MVKMGLILLEALINSILMEDITNKILRNVYKQISLGFISSVEESGVLAGPITQKSVVQIHPLLFFMIALLKNIIKSLISFRYNIKNKCASVA